MTRDLLPASIRDFLSRYIHSADELDVLVLVRSAPRKEWSALEVSASLHMDPISASNRLMGLYLEGLLGHQKARGQLYSYRWQAPRALDRTAGELVEVYSSQRDRLVEYIVRNQQVQMRAFADAFVLKRDE